MTFLDETATVIPGALRGRYVAMSPYGWLGAIGWTVLASLAGVVAFIVAMVIALLVLHGDVASRGLEGLQSLPQVEQMALGLYGMLAMQAAFVLMAFIAASRRGYRAADVLALRAPRSIWPFVWGPLLVIASAIVVGNILSFLMPFDSMQDMQMWLPLVHSEQWWLVFVVAAIGAPLSEEIWFRGFLLPSFARSFAGMGPGRREGQVRVTATGAILAAALATALLFSLAHVYHLPGAITVLSLGIVLSFILWRSGSLWAAIVSHGIYNLTVFSYVKWGMALAEAPV
jgi:membrane protease YdiL (CAAX protease family)